MNDSKRRVLLIAISVMALVYMAYSDMNASNTTPLSTVRSVWSLSGLPDQSAQSTGWYCAGGTGSAAGSPESVVLTNTSNKAQSAQVTDVPSSGPDKTQEVVIPSGAAKDVVPSQVVSASWVATDITVFGGGVTASETIGGSAGTVTSPCASATSPQWYLPNASTSGGKSAELSLLNPGDTDCEVDLTIYEPGTTPLEPPAFQGVVVPAGGLVAVDLADHVQNVKTFAISATTASGSLVATETETAPGSPGPVVSVALGVPGTSSRWDVAQSENDSSEVADLEILDPGTSPASVTVGFALGGGSVEPLQLEVPAESTATLDTTSLTRLPTSVAFSMLVTSRNGVPIAVFRSETSTSSTVSSLVPGAESGSQEWVVPVTEAGTTTISMVVQQLNGAPSVVTVDLKAPTKKYALHGARGTRISSGQSLFLVLSPSQFPSGSDGAGTVLEVSSSAQVVVSAVAGGGGSAFNDDFPAYPVQ